MDYLLKASAVLFIFYACYQLFLRKETFFQANRWFLLSGLIICCVIPLIVIPEYIEYTATKTNNFTITYDNLVTPPIIEEPFDYMQLIVWAYFGGILFFFGKLILDFLSLRKVFNSSTVISKDHFILFETTKSNPPFSFFNRIVYNPSQFKKDELKHIINHEKVHTKQLHSIDTIVSQIACILFWFNPIVWLYKKALQQNLEFIADRKAQHMSTCDKSYQTVLLKTSIPEHQLQITNNFYTSLIKKRIVMLHKSKSNSINQLKLMVVLPFLALFMMSFNTEEVYVEISSKESTSSALFQTNTIEQVFNKNMSDEDFLRIKKELANKGVTFNYSGIKRNRKGEITAIKTDWKYKGSDSAYDVKSNKAIEPFIFKSSGDIFVVGTFSDRLSKTYKTSDGKTRIQSTGSSNSYVVEEVEADSIFITKQSNRLINERDSLLVNNTKTWTGKDGKKMSINASENGNSKINFGQSEDPLIILDGKMNDKSALENLDTNSIESINVLKDKAAIEAYGDKGKNGVILVKTKSKNPWAITMSSAEVQTTEIKEKENKTTDLLSKKSPEDQPLYILDDAIISQKTLQAIDPNKIESMNVLKVENGIKLYGEKGKNGVIIIKTRSSTTTPTKSEALVIDYNDKSKNPLYIIDDKFASATEVKLLDTYDIESMSVLRDENATKSYGEKGKNGVIIIKTKSNSLNNLQNKRQIIEVEDTSNDTVKKSFTYTLSSANFNNNRPSNLEFIVSKNATDSFLEKQKRELLKHGIEAKFSKVRRNRAGEITGIKITLNDNNGQKSSASWKGNKAGIQDIVLGKSKDDQIFIREIGKKVNR